MRSSPSKGSVHFSSSVVDVPREPGMKRNTRLSQRRCPTRDVQAHQAPCCHHYEPGTNLLAQLDYLPKRVSLFQVSLRHAPPVSSTCFICSCTSSLFPSEAGELVLSARRPRHQLLLAPPRRKPHAVRNQSRCSVQPRFGPPVPLSPSLRRPAGSWSERQPSLLIPPSSFEWTWRLTLCVLDTPRPRSRVHAASATGERL